MIDPLILFWEFLKASMLSFSGTGNLPILHQSLLARGWATDQQFARALAIGQITPGPTGLWVICLGYLINGLPGALLSTLALVLPPLLVLVVHNVYLRIGHLPATQGFVRGLTLAVFGVFATILLGIWRTNGPDVPGTLIIAASIAIAASTRVPVPVLFAGAALAGALIYR